MTTTQRNSFEIGSYFCSENDCRLHVRPGDAGTQGSGNWARLENNVTVGRQLKADGQLVCDFCAAGRSCPAA